MPVIRINEEVDKKLVDRKIHDKESYNSIISRLISNSKFIYATGDNVKRLIEEDRKNE